MTESLGAGYLSGSYRDIYAFLLLIFVLMVKPSGLFGIEAKVKAKSGFLKLILAARQVKGRYTQRGTPPKRVRSGAMQRVKTVNRYQGHARK